MHPFARCIVIFSLVFTSGISAWAADDDFADGEDAVFDEEPASDQDSSESKEASKADGFEEGAGGEASGGQVFSQTLDVTREELQALKDASRARNEGALIKSASRILGKDPKHLIALNSLAVFYIEKQKYGIAKIILKRAMKDHADEPALHNNMGVIYLAEGDMPLALESFRKSIEAKSRYKLGVTNLSAIYLAHGDFKRSISPLEEAYKSLRPDLRRGSLAAAEVANNYGVALMGTGENGKAADVFGEIVESDVRLPEAYLNLSLLLVEGGKKKNDALRLISKLKFMTEDRRILKKAADLEARMGQ